MARKIIMFIICLAGALLNIAFNLFAARINLPLYLDTVITITITLLYGLFWGALCGMLTNIISHTLWFWGWEGYLFTLCSIATACITWLFIRFFPKELNLISRSHKPEIQAMKPPAPKTKSRFFSMVMDRIVALILLSFALCIGMSILGGSISALIQVLNPALVNEPGRYAFLGHTLFDENSPAILVEILSRIPVNIIDRLIAAFGGYGIAIVFVFFRKRLKRQ